MATIRASCPDCGDVELTTRDLNVRVCQENNQGSYTFRCPVCHMTVVKEAESRIVELLVSSGVKLSVWRLPSEMWERPTGSPITHDDLLDFHDLLSSEDWFERLSATTGDA